ncbi:hypothetical protein ACTFIR_010105 [Dictyostelium discoideum]
MECSDKIYMLYKSVFNNIFLLKKIFKIVRGINRQITNSNIKNKSYTQRLRFDEATFCWMIKNNFFELLYDKVKIGIEFEENEIEENELKLFIQHLINKNNNNNKNNILNKFYQKNKKQIKTLFLKNGENKLFSFSITTNNLEFVKIIHKDIIINKEIVEDSSILLDLAFKCGNLEIIKFINNEIVKNQKNYLNNKNLQQELLLISNVLELPNRNEVLGYLLDELKLSPKSKKLNDNNNYKLILLEFNLFKRLYNMGWVESLLDRFKQNSVTNKFSSITVNCSQFITYNHHNNQLITFNTFLNHLQNGLYLLSQIQKSDSLYYSEILNKINNLINNNNNNFIFEREIKRIFLFEFLKKVKDMVLLTNEDWVKLILNFICQYGDYNYLFEEINSQWINNDVTSSMIIDVSMKYADSQIIDRIKDLFKEGYHFDHSRGLAISHLIKLPPDLFFNPKTTPISKQLNFLDLLFKYNTNIKETIFKHIINNNILNKLKTNDDGDGDDDNENFKKIALIIKSYYFSNILTKPEYLNGNLLVGNENIFKYFYENNRDLFIWDHESISKLIIKSNNLNFIEYIHDNNIGGINKQTSINHSETIQVAKFMYEKLGYRFNGSLNNISELNEWESGYLFYYSIQKLIEYNNSLEESKPKIEISIGLDIYRNFKQRKFIYNLYRNGLITNNTLVGYQSESKLISLFNPINDINYVISTGNCKYIKDFIKSQPSHSLGYLHNKTTFSNLQLKNKRNKSITFINNEIMKFFNR